MMGRMVIAGSLFATAFTLAAGISDSRPAVSYFEHISLNDGLSMNSVYSILQDRRGFIWIGTQEGLNRFDGYSFVIYYHEAGNARSLSNSTVRAIIEDSSGVIWVGTDKGMNRYDREKDNFTRYIRDARNPSSLNDNNVTCILEDRSGCFWIGTQYGGLNRFDPKEGRFFNRDNDPGRAYRLSGNYVSALREDRFQTLWIATQDAGLFALSRDRQHLDNYRFNARDAGSLGSDLVKAIHEDRSGNLWIGTADGGLNRLDRERKRFIRYVHDPKNPGSLGSNTINAVYEDRAGTLWIGSETGGIDMLLPGAKGENRPAFIHVRHDPKEPGSLCSDMVRVIYQDRQESIWLGSNNGISKFDRLRKKFFHLRSDPNNPASLSFPRVRSIYEDRRGDLWVGMDYGGIDRFDGKTGKKVHFSMADMDSRLLGEDYVWTICQDQAGNLWFGTSNGGLIRFDSAGKRFTRFLHDPANPTSLARGGINSLCVDRQNRIWIGMNGQGLSFFDRGSRSFIHYRHDPADPNSLSDNTVRRVFMDSSGTIWIGTAGGGLNKLQMEGESVDKVSFVHYRNDPENPASISHDHVNVIQEDRQGKYLWLGTYGGGINRFDRGKGVFICYTEKDGLPNNVIYGILEDRQGNLWLTTNRGISRFNPGTGECKNFDASDGLQSLEFNSSAYFQSPSGEMFFGGINGLNAFFPEKIPENSTIPPIMLTDFQIFNRPVPIGARIDGRVILEKSITETSRIRLSYRDRSFSFGYAALNFYSPEKARYAHKMEGFDKDWNYVGNRRYVYYTGLPPGRYTFRVKGSNNDGVWNEKGAVLAIVITPPFWKTWWFMLLSGLAAAGALLGLYRSRVNRLEKRKAELEQLVEERTYKLKEAMAELERLSLTDSLTQLPNRRNFELIFAQEWKRCSRERHPLTVLMIDIDFFKLYNDTYGHLMGDECLQRVGACIQRSNSRAGDFVARLGGEEFAVILPNTPAGGASLMAERVRVSVEELNIEHSSSAIHSFVTISIGVATMVPSRDQESDALVAAADTALYQAKKGGRNRFFVSGA